MKWPCKSILHVSMLVVTALGFAGNVHAQAVCGTGGNCLVAHPSPGCNVSECCVAVCAVDPFCCNNQWDNICANEAASICATCGGAGAGSCFVVHSIKACNNAACCNTVCAADPFCCNTSWDGICVNEAQNMCAGCGDPNNGSCFEAHGTPGCNNQSCCQLVCDADTFCCTNSWDSICVSEAQTMCAGCGNSSNGSCFVSHASPGCNNASCCGTVCDADPFCCESSWDSICVNEAQELCAGCGVSSNGNCYVAHSSTGCNDLSCCELVCDADPFCCASSWDGICANEAVAMCSGCGNPNGGSCFAAHSGHGCNNAVCCSAVCAVDSFCCTNTWDSICASEANTICATCGGAGAGSCFAAHPNKACNNAECCNAVCAVDSFCCNTTWDSICASEAATICGTCGGAGAGSCFVAHPNAACNNSACCSAVCNVDPFCCNVTWDGICASEATSICNSCGGSASGSCFIAHSNPHCNNNDCCASVCAIDSFCCNNSWDGICVNEAKDLCGCPADIAPAGGDGKVNVDDLLAVINSWGACSNCPADIVPPGNNGVVNVDDLLFIINHWGSCPGTCNSGFNCPGSASTNCGGGGSSCICWIGYYGNLMCALNSSCGGLTTCNDGVCPDGFVCIKNTCCAGGAPICLPTCGSLLYSPPEAGSDTALGIEPKSDGGSKN